MDTSRHLRSRVAAGLLVCLAAAPTGASVVPAMDLPRLTSRSSRIVVGEILTATSAWDAQRRSILTTVEVQVAELWKGPMPAGRRFTFTQPGGTVGDIEMRVHGLPGFRAGDRALLFLGGEPGRLFLTGLGQGHRPLRFDPARGRWLVQPGDRSAAVLPRQAAGRGARLSLQPAPSEPAVPLDHLRAQVKELLR